MVDRIVTVPDSLELPAAVKVPTSRLSTATATGKAVLNATNAAAARAAIGAGTSSLEIATVPEVAAGTDPSRAVTPLGVKTVLNAGLFRNLLMNPIPSSIDGWVDLGGRGFREFDGDAVIFTTTGAFAALEQLFGTGLNTTWLAHVPTPSTTYTVSVDVMASVDMTCVLLVNERDANGTQTRNVARSPKFCPAGSWVRLSSTETTTSNTSFVGLRVAGQDPVPAGISVSIRRAAVELGATDGTWESASRTATPIGRAVLTATDAAAARNAIGAGASSWAVSIPPTATVPQATDRPNGSFAPPNGRLYFRPFRALQRTYSQIGLLVTTAGTGTVRFAIFARGANGSVGELLLDCGSVSPTATGAIWSMINWTPSQPDVYLAVVCQDPGALQVSCTNSASPVMSNGVILASNGGNDGNYFQSGVSGPIPAAPTPATFATSGSPTIVIA